MRPRVLLVDNHQVFREGLATLLGTNWGYDVCGQAENGLEAVHKTLDLRPDVVILDLLMPVMGGAQAATRIRRLSPSTKIVFLSMNESPSVVKLLRLAGADAYVSKHEGPKQLHTTIVELLNAPCFHNVNRPTPRFFDPT
jgi:DNA-binding NarL/FixJ family response regulator